ncbi:MAG TPA: efflux RND transporter periplasmic adaptor subunit [Planctomycetaceae bacterium]|nr:efflux RND transporter periplasmic adaptor subunit [Planctomycetaceae bacterium]HQZ68090.1 efflux RND transporter periplasmic adaptor subunit [Planctomycetaceae bacterium]
MMHLFARDQSIRNLIAMTCWLFFAVGCQKSTSDSTKTAAVAPSKTTHPVSEASLNTIELTEDAVRRLGIEMQPVSMRVMVRMRSYGADLSLPAGASIIVSSPLAGTVQVPAGSTFPQIGQRVGKGETLLSLLPMLSPEREVLTPAERIRFAEAQNTVVQAQIDAEAQVQQSMVQVEATQIALERAERLLKDKSGTVRAVDEAQAQLQMAQKALEAAKLRKQTVDSIKLDTAAGTLKPLTIESPLVGIVRSIQVQPSQLVFPGAPLFEVLNDEQLWVRVPVYVGDVEELDFSRKARLTLLDGRQSDQDILVEPLAAPPTAMSLASTVDYYYLLPNPTSAFRPGQKVAAHLTLKGDAESPAIPWSAVFHDIYGGQWVYEVAADRQYIRRRIEVISVSDGWAAIARGPAVGTQVVTAGVAELAGTEFGFAK